MQDETGVARAIASGDLLSPQRFGNFLFWAIRITGTGAAFRNNPAEFCWRDPALYLNDSFLARCNGLPVVWEHCKKGPLNSDEYQQRNVGSICLPYIKGDEVWGIARIYDDDANALLARGGWSTSPHVILTEDVTENTVRMETGEPLLIEGKAFLLDNVAICERGVWDKGGAPTGVDTSGVDQMADKEKEADASEAKEAEGERKDEGGVPDKLLDAIGKLSARMDAWEAADKERKDAAEKERMDASACSEKERADAAAATEEKERQEREDKARKDAADMKARLDALEKRDSQPSGDEEAAMADAQSKADSVMVAHGKRAAPPMRGETPLAYRRRLAREIQPHSAGWKDVDLAALPENAFGIAEAQIRADAMKAANDPTGIPAGTLRPIRRVLPTGHTETTFQGDVGVTLAPWRMKARRVTGIGVRKEH